jgi:hypothetical protein
MEPIEDQIGFVLKLCRFWGVYSFDWQGRAASRPNNCRSSGRAGSPRKLSGRGAALPMPSFDEISNQNITPFSAKSALSMALAWSFPAPSHQWEWGALGVVGRLATRPIPIYEMGFSPEHVLLCIPAAGDTPAGLMLNHFYGLFGELVLDSLAAAALLFVGYLLRLQIRQVRRRRRDSKKGLQFGLVQDVTVLKRPLAAHPIHNVPLPHFTTTTVSTNVLGQDIASRIWTDSPKPAAFSNRWN